MTSFLGGRHEHGGSEEAEGEEHEHEEGLNEEEIGNRPRIDRDVRALKDFVYLVRWENFWTLSQELDAQVGLSGLYGPNATGPRGNTWIYGLDMKWKWRPATHFRGWPFVVWQTELMQRDFRADRFTFIDKEDPGEIVTFPSRTLHDRGLYSQVLYGFHYRWAAGLRYEFASGSGKSIGGRRNDPFRADRHRLSPLLVWHPSEFTRIRLQYNFDHADSLGSNKEAHSVWLGFQWFYGFHPPHEY